MAKSRKNLQPKVNGLSPLIKIIYTIVSVMIIFTIGTTITNLVHNQLDEFINVIPNTSKDENIALESVTLERVVDGDTIIVNTSSNEELRVRLIGIDTPESVHPNADKNTESGDLASDYTKSLLEVGQTLYLEYDEERLDPYDRTLAYVWLEQVKTIDTESLQLSC